MIRSGFCLGACLGLAIAGAIPGVAGVQAQPTARTTPLPAPSREALIIALTSKATPDPKAAPTVIGPKAGARVPPAKTRSAAAAQTPHLAILIVPTAGSRRSLATPAGTGAAAKPASAPDKSTPAAAKPIATVSLARKVPAAPLAATPVRSQPTGTAGPLKAPTVAAKPAFRPAPAAGLLPKPAKTPAASPSPKPAKTPAQKPPVPTPYPTMAPLGFAAAAGIVSPAKQELARFAFTLSSAVDVRITASLEDGKARTIIYQQKLNAGEHEVSWDGGKLDAGIYDVVIEAGERKEKAKVIVIR